ncbi:hypothetical protein [Streptomyces sp. NPDC001205]
MAIKDQAQVFWRAWVGQEPRTMRERADLMGLDEAARAGGVTPRTVKDWIRAEERAIPKTVDQAVKEMGGIEAAARAAGRTPKTIRGWLRGEQRGRTPGKRQAQHIEQLTNAAREKHIAALKPRGNQAKVAAAVLKSPQARQRAMSSRRASRMSTSGAHLTITAKVTIDTGRRPDERWREINMNFRDDKMAEPTQAFLSGNDTGKGGVVDKLSKVFGDHYAPGTDWKFGEFRAMKIGKFDPSNGRVFPDHDH